MCRGRFTGLCDQHHLTKGPGEPSQLFSTRKHRRRLAVPLVTLHGQPEKLRWQQPNSIEPLRSAGGARVDDLDEATHQVGLQRRPLAEVGGAFGHVSPAWLAVKEETKRAAGEASGAADRRL